MLSPVQRRGLLQALGLMLASGALMLVASGAAAAAGAGLAIALALQTVVGAGGGATVGAAMLGRWPRLGVFSVRALVGAVGIGLALALLGSGCVTVTWHVVPASRATLDAQAAALAPLLGGEVWVALVTLAVLPGILEEVLYRGAMREGLAGWTPGRRAIVLGVIFAAAHGSPWAAAPLFVVGAVLARLADRSGGWGLAALAHVVLNGFGVAVWGRVFADGAAPIEVGALAIAGGGGGVAFALAVLRAPARPPAA